jgi:hypothetical protein
MRHPTPKNSWVTVTWWDGTNNARRLTFPNDNLQDANSSSMKELRVLCEGSDHNAGGLGPDQFSTTFQPDRYGILQKIQRLLFPERLPDTRVTADLHKLNVWHLSLPQDLAH